MGEPEEFIPNTNIMLVFMVSDFTGVITTPPDYHGEYKRCSSQSQLFSPSLLGEKSWENQCIW